MRVSQVFVVLIYLLMCLIVYKIIKHLNAKQVREPHKNLPDEPLIFSGEIENEEIENEELEKLLNWRAHQLSTLIGFLNLKTLISEKGLTQVGYRDLLNTAEWKFKRLQILINDWFKCRDCNSRSISNHVHHTYYLQDHLPWDIDARALVTLCQSCHIRRHQVEKIKVYEKRPHGLVPASKKYSYCNRCGGSGYLPQFNHVQNGICFKCWGDCIDNSIFKNALTYFQSTSSPNYDEQLKNEFSVYLNSITLDTYKAKIDESQIFNNKIEDISSGGENTDLPF